MPVTAGLVAGGLQTLGGLAQTIFSGQKKANRKLDAFVKTIKPSGSIMDYYNKALAKYDANPYTSQSYQQQQNQIGRNLATGISSSQTRRGGLATIGGLVQGANDASARAASAAEQRQGQDLSRLGQAAQLKTREMQRPEEMRYNLLAQKAGQAATRGNQGLQNIFGGLTTVASIGLPDNTGSGSGTAGTGRTTGLGAGAWGRSTSKIGKR